MIAVKSCLERVNGNLCIESAPDVGTKITMEIPVVQSAPEHLSASISLVPHSSVVILDDFNTVKDLWKLKMNPFIENSKINIVELTNGTSLADTLKKTENVSLLLIDYQLNAQDKNGLQWIIDLGIQSKSILVTSKWDDQKLLEICKKEKIRILPKNLVSFIPLSLASSVECNDWDFIVIDDCPFTKKLIERMSPITGKKVGYFASIDDFNKVKSQISKSMRIYVDFYLKDMDSPVRGDTETLKLSQEGFTKLFIYTGEDKNVLPPMPWACILEKKELPWHE